MVIKKNPKNSKSQLLKCGINWKQCDRRQTKLSCPAAANRVRSIGCFFFFTLCSQDTFGGFASRQSQIDDRLLIGVAVADRLKGLGEKKKYKTSSGTENGFKATLK